ncbi:GNAT family N-acetyltransferase [Pseudomonas sp. RHF3.3-3]|uniref:GNAT family N-acetyltransferase n=1 Tax=Pseudomonas sp. RHF3.3-3 TaxID=3396624 RepID=UPI003A87DC6A
MRFKQPSVQDAESLLSFFIRLVGEDSERVERSEDVSLLTQSMEEAWVGQLIEKEHDGEGIAICVLDESSAIVGLGEVERRSRWIERHVAEIRFGLLPGYHAQGVALIELLQQRARGIDIEVLYYFHLATQRQGIEVVRSCGFEYSGSIPDYYKKEGIYISREFYSKRIG